MKYKFKDRMFTDPLYAPYYSKYKGHHFIVVNIPYSGHAEIQCINDPTLKVDGLVHYKDLEKVPDGD